MVYNLSWPLHGFGLPPTQPHTLSKLGKFGHTTQLLGVSGPGDRGKKRLVSGVSGQASVLPSGAHRGPLLAKMVTASSSVTWMISRDPVQIGGGGDKLLRRMMLDFLLSQ